MMTEAQQQKLHQLADRYRHMYDKWNDRLARKAKRLRESTALVPRLAAKRMHCCVRPKGYDPFILDIEVIFAVKRTWEAVLNSSPKYGEPGAWTVIDLHQAVIAVRLMV